MHPLPDNDSDHAECGNRLGIDVCVCVAVIRQSVAGSRMTATSTSTVVMTNSC